MTYLPEANIYSKLWSKALGRRECVGGPIKLALGKPSKKKTPKFGTLPKRLKPPLPTPPNLDVLSLDILRYLRPPLPHPLVWTISRKKFVPKTKDYNLRRNRYQRKKDNPLMMRDKMSHYSLQ